MIAYVEKLIIIMNLRCYYFKMKISLDHPSCYLFFIRDLFKIVDFYNWY